MARGPRSAMAKSNAEPKKPTHQAGRPTVEELNRRKAKVMEIATTHFLNRGYVETTFVDIAKEAGVATRTLYQHFGDKESIFFEVLAAREEGAVFTPPDVPAGVTLFDALMHISKYICEVSLRPKSVDFMRLMIAESRRFPEFMIDLSGKTFSHYRKNVAAMFDELIERGLLPSIDTLQAAAIFIDLILGHTPLLVFIGWASSRPTEDELKDKIELFILGRIAPAIVKQGSTV